ncbi:hypothetical protein TW65_09287 [Stemphylium lycopersici]|nr:hypothetical protein TW65_09287 [Stemphylium lycopersici]
MALFSFVPLFLGFYPLGKYDFAALTNIQHQFTRKTHPVAG